MRECKGKHKSGSPEYFSCFKACKIRKAAEINAKAK